MRYFLLTATAVFLTGCAGVEQSSEVDTASSQANPVAEGGTIPTAAEDSADVTLVKLETTKGDVIIEVHPEWAPKGSARFIELVEAGYYDGVKWFRVLDGFMAQTGMAADPEVNAKWKDKTIADDPVTKSNTRAYVSFATSGPDSRTTQFFINYADNSNLDSMGFSPFGKVVKGMDVVDSLYSKYGEGAPRGRGPSQGMIAMEGNRYLEANFPKLDAIKKASVIEDAAGGDKSGPAGDGPSEG